MALSGLLIGSLVLLLLLLLPYKLHSQSSSSSDLTDFTFGSFDGREEYLIYQGHAHTPQRSIRLTSADEIFLPTRDITVPYPLPDSVGRVVYSPPVRLWDAAGRRQANFQTEIRGFIGSAWGIPLADGISFFIAPVNTTIPSGSTRGHMGLYDASGSSPTQVFAVELDVSVNAWDPSFRHVGINLNSRTSESVESWPINERFGGAVVTRITYDVRQKLVTVVANASGTISARLEHRVDLKTILPEWVQIGISASTAQQDAALHDIYSWSFTSFLISDQQQYAATS